MTAEKLRAIGDAITLETINATAALVAPLHARIGRTGVKVTRDFRYGPAERNRSTCSSRNSARAQAPPPASCSCTVAASSMGDKTNPNGGPFYDNVGYWAVAQRHDRREHHVSPGASSIMWPSGSDDVGARGEMGAREHRRCTVAIRIACM